ncbi:MAG: aminotransferase class III-fold pyridoxal phosphate-dependent enzyme, partial [Candidatus Eremiobacteraeota bacterium]|nr:aminotransferase class III-fold pyridoxal phosphate-dependent enzyme [Candidatus Eremiobacteraeota bacterium]
MSFTQVRTGFAVAPILEETAHRYGFFGGWTSGGHYRISQQGLEGLVLFGQPLSFKHFTQRFSLASERDGELEFPSQVASFDSWCQWRDEFREFLQVLAEENPGKLGRDPLYRWVRPRTVDAPFSQALGLSQRFLERTYQDDFIVREKKEMVVDYRSCQGNYLVSIDRDEYGPLCALLDCSSQIASHIVGFNGFILQGVLAHVQSFTNPDYRKRPVPVARSFKNLLRRWAPDGLTHICFCNSGTESWEKAVLLAQHKFPDKGPRVVCFEGSFHGRTLLALFSSWNPSKRIPFQLEGFETPFVAFPEDKEPHLDRRAPEGWSEAWHGAAGEDWQPPIYDDELLAREVASLVAVRDLIKTGDACAVSVEPLQCEGGDRFATKRFFQALRLLTEAFGVGLIFDEVQTGFGLGGTPLWSDQFELPSPPDFINLAKKCQVGCVLSSIPDPEPTAAHAASMARGYYNALAVEPAELEKLGRVVAQELCKLTGDYEMVTAPRGRALCFAFDLPDAETANAFVNQRFHRGHMVYIAGERTIRFRLQLATRPKDVEIAFSVIRETLDWLQEHGTEATNHGDYAWQEPVPTSLKVPEGPDDLAKVDWAGILRHFGQLDSVQQKAFDHEIGPHDPVGWFRTANKEGRVTWLTFLRYLAAKHAPVLVGLTPEMWEEYREQIMELEHSIYEPARQDSEEFLRGIVEADRQLCILALSPEGEVAGYSFSAPIKNFSKVRGPHEDPEMGRGTTLYSADIGVHSDYRGMGLGLRLKRRQVEQARQLGFSFIRSRNRIDSTAAMMLINQAFGSRELRRYEKDYGADQATSLYWSLPLSMDYHPTIDWSGGVEEPTGGLLDPAAWQDWDLAAVNKNSLCNWWTPNMVRHIEWLREVSPLPHLYLASGRDEAADKAVKCLIYARKGANRCVSFTGSYWGHTTATARSLSDSRYLGYFPWDHIEYPTCPDDPFLAPEGALNDEEERRLQQVAERLEKPEEVLGVFIEPLQERTGE